MACLQVLLGMKSKIATAFHSTRSSLTWESPVYTAIGQRMVMATVKFPRVTTGNRVGPASERFTLERGEVDS